MSSSARAFEVDEGSLQPAGQGLARRARTACAHAALVAVVAAAGFCAGKMSSPSHAANFLAPPLPPATPLAPVRPGAPVVSVRELIAGMQQPSKGPTLNALTDAGESDRSLARFDACKTYCCRRDAIGLAIGAAAAAMGTPALAASATTVTVGGQAGHVAPTEVKICKGDSVTWIYTEPALLRTPHNIVFTDAGAPQGAGGQNFAAQGNKVTRAFGVAGTFEYYCDAHPDHGIIGRVVVMD
mmetsp:Transcript_96005/g.271747  ORF Transcript_96005/g.271747 Transcript_96005/m.271747 type:complete len:241 (+) Transcript_96005:88-810(+)